MTSVTEPSLAPHPSRPVRVAADGRNRRLPRGAAARPPAPRRLRRRAPSPCTSGATRAAAPLLLAHGGFDFAGTFDVFAPLLADAGWRVVSWDHRGHGDSEHAALYSWEADLRDAVAVLDSVDRRPVPVVGHSQGRQPRCSSWPTPCPHRVSHLVNLDGLPSRRAAPTWPTTSAPAARQRARPAGSTTGGRLGDRSASPGTLDELAGAAGA